LARHSARNNDQAQQNWTIGRIMARGPCTFRETDVKRAFKAAKAAGMKVTGLKVPKDGGFVLLTGAEEKSDLDQELSEFERRHGSG
jgi:hypothetical protein